MSGNAAGRGRGGPAVKWLAPLGFFLLALAAPAQAAMGPAGDPLAPSNAPAPSAKPRATPKPGPQPPGPFTGRYETGWQHIPTIELTLLQRGADVRGGLTLVADHRGRRVLTAEFSGRVAGESINLKWRDHYGNEGVATMWLADGAKNPKKWRMNSVIKKATNDGRWLEGQYNLWKTASQVSPAEIPGGNR